MARAFAPPAQTLQGLGLVREQVNQAGQATPVYDRKLSVAEVQQRIAHYWKPYHAALAQAIRWSVDRFGCVWHLNLHSMPSDVYQRLGVARKTPGRLCAGGSGWQHLRPCVHPSHR